MILEENCNNRIKKEHKRYADIKCNDIANGPGVSLSFWTQGCTIKCKNCHNFSIWDFDGGKSYTTETRNDILKSINKNGIERNLSILGGEPLDYRNSDVVFDLVSNTKERFPNKKIWMWTGYIFENIDDDFTKLILNYVDVLVDGPFIEEKKDIRLKYKGSTNQRVIDVKKSIEQNKVVIIEEYND